MNTERTPHSAEDDDSTDSATISFGSGGPAFRPIPRIERSAAPPAPKPPESPRLPKVIFDRSLEAVQAVEAKKSAEDDDDDDAEDTPAPPRTAAPVSAASRTKPRTAPKSPAEAMGASMAVPEVADAEAQALLQHEAQADSHLPDLGEFTATLPETPPVPGAHASQPAPERAPVEPHPALPVTENKPLNRTYPAETAADLPEWPEKTSDSADPPLSPTPPRQRPAVSQHGQFEAPPSSVVDANEAVYATAARTTGSGRTPGGGGGGLPPLPPAGAAGGMPPGNQPPNAHNAYFGMSGHNPNTIGSGGGGFASGGYNPNAVPNSTKQPRYEAVQPVAQKKGNIWPYVAVLAENIARKRADRKLKKEMSTRMDQQERTQEASSANQLRLERQQQEMLDNQRRQAIREAHRPSGNEWGVPRSVSTAGTVPGQRPGEHAPISVMGRPEQSAPIPMQPAEQQLEQPAELAGQSPGRERHSAWHTYYEDENGHPEVSGVEYGKGFKQEQKEIVRDHTGDSVVAGVAGAAGVAGTAGRSGGGGGGPSGTAGPAGTYGYGQTSGQGYQPQQPTLPSGMTAPGLPQGTPPADPQHQLPEHTKKTNVPGPLFWLMISLIILAFFAAALI